MKKVVNKLLVFSGILLIFIAQQIPIARDITSVNFKQKRIPIDVNKPLIDSMKIMFLKMDSSKAKLKYKLDILKCRQRTLISQTDTIKSLSLNQ